MTSTLPKPPGQRVRRNKDQPQWRALPAGGRAGSVPALPVKKPAWLKLTREWWASIWASPMAVAWLPSDVPTLVRLARIVDQDNRGEASAALLSEARQLEDRFGLSPRARRLLQWEVSQASGAVEPTDDDDEVASVAVRAPASRVRRLKAV